MEKYSRCRNPTQTALALHFKKNCKIRTFVKFLAATTPIEFHMKAKKAVKLTKIFLDTIIMDTFRFHLITENLQHLAKMKCP